jgi:hypothetical protein
MGLLAEMAYWEAEVKRNKARMERNMWDFRMMRGPMIEADIDWRVPVPNRSMVEGDL